MKIILPGGSGQVGTLLARAFHNAGHEVTVLSRRTYHAPWRVVQWDARHLGAWTPELEGADVVINLAGRSVNCRYNAENRRAIIDSRVQSTRILGKALSYAKNPPRVWLQSSTATIYAHFYDAPNDEANGIIDDAADVPETWNFSAGVAKQWESAADEWDLPRTRIVKLRSAMIMSADRGGVFDVLLSLVRCGLGGQNGDGRQFVSWMHEADFVRAIDWLIAHDELCGAVNLCAPQPLPNAEFMRALRRAWGIKIGLPATKAMLGIGTFLLRTESELILKSRRVVPTRLQQSGFQFEFPDWPAAARDLCRRWRETDDEKLS